MTEQQPYDVIAAYDGFELRRYPEHVIAEVSVRAPFESAGNAAFRPLFDYINGNNRARQSVAMTAPVAQTQKVAMTAPVVQSGDGDEQAIAFVLPATMTEETAPEPTNPAVTIRTVPASLSAAARYSGRWSKSAYDHHRAKLESAIDAAGLTAIGPPRFARYDPPFKPWFLRRNEIVIDVARRVS